MAKRHPSALKRNRQNQKRRLRNRAVRAQTRTEVRKTREALDQGDVGRATAAVQSVMSTLMKAAKKGVLHRNAVSRRIARLSRRLHLLRQPASATESAST